MVRTEQASIQYLNQCGPRLLTHAYMSTKREWITDIWCHNLFQIYLHDASALRTVSDMGFELAPGFHYMVDIHPSTVGML